MGWEGKIINSTLTKRQGQMSTTLHFTTEHELLAPRPPPYRRHEVLFWHYISMPINNWSSPAFLWTWIWHADVIRILQQTGLRSNPHIFAWDCFLKAELILLKLNGASAPWEQDKGSTCTEWQCGNGSRGPHAWLSNLQGNLSQKYLWKGSF